jgi:hypothetical protein
MTKKIATTLLIATLFVCFASLSYAGPGSHGANNGGDISELQTIQVWTQADKMVSHCLLRVEKCDVEGVEIEFLKSFIESFASRGSISFRASKEDWTFRTEQEIGAEIVINSLKLYEDNQPISYGEISTQVLQALFYQFGLAKVESHQLGEKISSLWNCPKGNSLIFMDQKPHFFG